MLQRLKIENYALIRLMDTTFKGGFYSITGETGAGKSIMLGALGLVLGARADKAVLWEKASKCIVEAWFSIDKDLKPLFDKYDLDFASESVFHREITPTGKSRAFVNDTPVSLETIREIASHLIDIHSQHNTLSLKNPDFQFSILDSYIDNKNIFDQYKHSFAQLKALEKQIAQQEALQAQMAAERSYYEFLSSEFEKLNLQEGEQTQAEEEVRILSNAEEIKSHLFETIALLSAEEETNQGVIALLFKAKQTLSPLANYDNIKDSYQRLDSVLIEIKDICSELETTNEGISLNNEKLQQLQERLDSIYILEKKHNVFSLEELLATKDNINAKLKEGTNISQNVDTLKATAVATKKEVSKLAQQITELRLNAGKAIEQDLQPLLKDLGMAEANLKISLTQSHSFSPQGQDEIAFLFNANNGGQLQEISKVISGGELSRLMLALKAIMSTKSNMPTMIFDEIDSGVSGSVASKVASIMQRMSKGHQIIAITHLPQIAAKANYQFKVFKKIEAKSTLSELRLLSEKERIEEIALMISNGKITANVLANAQELLS
jgi:DNA repair protein RecN